MLLELIHLNGTSAGFYSRLVAFHSRVQLAININYSAPCLSLLETNSKELYAIILSVVLITISVVAIG